MEPNAKGFRGLTAWKQAYALTLGIYALSQKFPKQERYGLVSQLLRAAVSIPANIAEGYERNYRKEYIQFLFIAKGSLGEVETFLMLARDLGYMPEEDFAAVEDKRKETALLLIGLIKSLS